MVVVGTIQSQHQVCYFPLPSDLHWKDAILRQKGILDRSFPLQKVAFRKSCSYNRMLEKCQAELYPDAEPTSTFFMADGSGCPIHSEDTLCVDTEDGSELCLAWTLQNNIRLCNQKYPSRVCYYCVEKKGEIWCLCKPHASLPYCSQRHSYSHMVY